MDDNARHDTIELVTAPSLVSYGECPILLISKNENALDVTLDFLVDNWPTAFKIFHLKEINRDSLHWANTILPHMRHVVVDASDEQTMVVAAWFATNPNASVFVTPVMKSGQPIDVPVDHRHVLQEADLIELVDWRMHSAIQDALRQRLELAAK